MSWLLQVKFWLLLTLAIPSTICSILVFIYFFRRWNRLTLDHHLTLILVTVCFIQLTTNFPFIIIYNHFNWVVPTTDSFCLWWNWWEYGLNGVLLFAMAWGSIERHLLVFHRGMMITRKQRILFHLLPISLACLYPLLLYFIVVILNPCQNYWHYNEVFCGIPCYLIDYPILATYDFIADIVFPVLVIASANVSLIIRVVLQKRQHNVAWRRQRKLTRQLIGIAIIYILFWFPLTLGGLVLTFTSSSDLLSIQVNYFFFFVHFIPGLLPFTSITSLSDFKKTVFGKQGTIVTPFTL
ncbi:unnamed protein product [Adineta ricciae]|uniref:G-protein coupled receptors family 1 profile domain-containing protein n=1 Tax=Adineta ricciae TaxID=249248 RepID=A0A814B4N6_ADIRI|nr:unnamed protein product [Adineta ricciae]CAF1590080.1 unnamed protein product [Adineta ricciae]